MIARSKQLESVLKGASGNSYLVPVRAMTETVVRLSRLLASALPAEASTTRRTGQRTRHQGRSRTATLCQMSNDLRDAITHKSQIFYTAAVHD